MKKLIAIIITFIFIFDGTGYCLRAPQGNLSRISGSLDRVSKERSHRVLASNKMLLDSFRDFVEAEIITPDFKVTLQAFQRYIKTKYNSPLSLVVAQRQLRDLWVSGLLEKEKTVHGYEYSLPKELRRDIRRLSWEQVRDMLSDNTPNHIYSIAMLKLSTLPSKKSQERKYYFTNIKDIKNAFKEAMPETAVAARRERYVRMTSIKLIALCEQKLNRILSVDERKIVSKLIKAFSNIRSQVGVTEVLNNMLISGGHPNVCIETQRKAHIFLDSINLPHHSITTMFFIPPSSRYLKSTFYPVDYRIQSLWWDFGEGDTPVHQFIVMNFIGILFVLDLSGDQFVMQRDKESFENTGIILIPVEDLQQADWPYVGGNTYVFGNNEKQLLSVLNNSQAYLDLLTKKQEHDIQKALNSIKKMRDKI